MIFKHQEFIEFEKADPGGIIFFAEAYSIAHKAFEKFICEIGIGWDNWFAHPEYAVPLRHTEAEHVKPIFAGKNLSIEIHLTKLSDSTLAVKYQLIDEASDLCAEVQTVHTFISKANFQKASVPSEFRDKLNPYLKS